MRERTTLRTTAEILAPVAGGRLDYLMVTPSLVLFPDPANSRLRSPSLAVGYVMASVKKAGFTARYVDMDACLVTVERLLDFIDRNRPRLIGLAAVTTTVKTAAAVADRIKERDPQIPICLGGVHATMMPRETLDEFPMFDFLVRGEGECVIPEVLRRIGGGRGWEDVAGVVTRSSKDLTSCRVEDLDSLPFPAWEEFDLARYPGVDLHRTARELPILSARGCPYDCCFCCRQPGLRQVRYRSVERILEELTRNVEQFGAEAIFFVDETFTINRPLATEICEALLARGLHRRMRWSCSTRVDAADAQTFKLMKRAGCYDVFFGFESGDDRLLEIAGKHITTGQMRDAVRMAKEAGLAVHGCFILGLPGETESTIEKAWILAKELDLRGVSFPIAVPFPGTRLWDMANRGQYGLRILSQNWDDYGKQYPGVMEQGELTIEKLLYYQQKSYLNHPVKWDYPWPEDELDRARKKALHHPEGDGQIIPTQTRRRRHASGAQGHRSTQGVPC
jgi:anaerobic magnesium-protoporphyrin IX monomethyl ester cyclase